MSKMILITQEQLKSVINYDPEAGTFTWVNPSSRRMRVGDSAGWVTRYGYLLIRINRRGYLAHRLAWLYVHGEWPKQQVDHINGIRTDNRIANLRDVSASVNGQNRRRADGHSKSGVLGCFLWRGKWTARITINGEQRHLGVFSSSEEASAAYLLAKRELHEGCTI